MKTTMTNYTNVIEKELARRVRRLSTEELLALVAKNRVAEARKRTIAEAIMTAAANAGKAMSTRDIVAETIRLRPDAQEPTIRAGISKLASLGVLLRKGPKVGGTYEAPV